MATENVRNGRFVVETAASASVATETTVSDAESTVSDAEMAMLASETTVFHTFVPVNAALRKQGGDHHRNAHNQLI